MENFSATVLPRAMFYGSLGRLNFRRNLGVSWKIALLRVLFWEYCLYQAFFPRHAIYDLSVQLLKQVSFD